MSEEGGDRIDLVALVTETVQRHSGTDQLQQVLEYFDSYLDNHSDAYTNEELFMQYFVAGYNTMMKTEFAKARIIFDAMARIFQEIADDGRAVLIAEGLATLASTFANPVYFPHRFRNYFAAHDAFDEIGPNNVYLDQVHEGRNGWYMIREMFKVARDHYFSSFDSMVGVDLEMNN